MKEKTVYWPGCLLYETQKRPNESQTIDKLSLFPPDQYTYMYSYYFKQNWLSKPLITYRITETAINNNNLWLICKTAHSLKQNYF